MQTTLGFSTPGFGPINLGADNPTLEISLEILRCGLDRNFLEYFENRWKPWIELIRHHFENLCAKIENTFQVISETTLDLKEFANKALYWKDDNHNHNNNNNLNNDNNKTQSKCEYSILLFEMKKGVSVSAKEGFRLTQNKALLNLLARETVGRARENSFEFSSLPKYGKPKGGVGGKY